jgi:tetratricopeptide (TPR) repeat protein
MRYRYPLHRPIRRIRKSYHPTRDSNIKATVIGALLTALISFIGWCCFQLYVHYTDKTRTISELKSNARENFHNGNFYQSLLDYNNIIAISDNFIDKGSAYEGIAKINLVYKDYFEAIDSLNKALEYYKIANNINLTSMTHDTIGTIYETMAADDSISDTENLREDYIDLAIEQYKEARLIEMQNRTIQYLDLKIAGLLIKKQKINEAKEILTTLEKQIIDHNILLYHRLLHYHITIIQNNLINLRSHSEGTKEIMPRIAIDTIDLNYINGVFNDRNLISRLRIIDPNYIDDVFNDRNLASRFRTILFQFYRFYEINLNYERIPETIQDYLANQVIENLLKNTAFFDSSQLDAIIINISQKIEKIEPIESQDVGDFFWSGGIWPTTPFYFKNTKFPYTRFALNTLDRCLKQFRRLKKYTTLRNSNITKISNEIKERVLDAIRNEIDAIDRMHSKHASWLLADIIKIFWENKNKSIETEHNIDRILFLELIEKIAEEHKWYFEIYSSLGSMDAGTDNTWNIEDPCFENP